jgi:hypothetical protein
MDDETLAQAAVPGFSLSPYVWLRDLVVTRKLRCIPVQLKDCTDDSCGRAGGSYFLHSGWYLGFLGKLRAGNRNLDAEEP